MLTAPITNDAFHSRVLTVLSTHLGALTQSNTGTQSILGQADIPPTPIIANLTPADTSLRPEGVVSQLILYTSFWIDLCSPDPVIADISRQVLMLEIGYASFCGATNVMVKGPTSSPHAVKGESLARYARVIQDVLNASGYVNLQILLSAGGASEEDNEEIGSLACFVEAIPTKSSMKGGNGQLESWDAWNTIRSICKYNSRLSVGKNESFLPSLWASRPRT